MRRLIVFVIAVATAFGEKVPTEKLIELAQKRAPELEQALRDTLGEAMAGCHAEPELVHER
jgi:hypothetical protein